MNRIRPLLCTLLLSAGTGLAGTFTAGFATPDTSGFFISGSGILADSTGWYPIIATNRLILTLNQGSLSGSFSPYDMDGGAPIQAFDAKFKLQFGPGSSPPADGAAFSFGPDVDQTSTTYNEVGAGGASFAVSFHTYTSNGGPAVDVYLFGQRIATTPMAVTNMVNSQLQDVEIQLNANSTLNVSYRGQTVYTNLYLPNWGPTNGFFIISARTGGSSEETHIANVSINTTLATTPVAPTVRTAPQNVTANEGSSASFSVGVDGTGPFTFQWTKNGANITDATNQTLTLPLVLYADNNASIAVKITNPVSTITSPSATLTVIQDTTVPTVTKAAADMTFTAIFVTYSKPVSDTALAASHYALDQNLTVSGVTRINTQTVKLTTSQMAQGKTYTLTINGVQDIDTIPNTIAANTTVQVRSFVYLGGTLLHKVYFNGGWNDGSVTSSIFTYSGYPDTPSRVDLTTGWEWPPNSAGTTASDPNKSMFIDSLEGYFIPPTTGNYTFFTCGDDEWYLYLSTDDKPANMLLVAQETGGWSNNRDWVTGQSTDMTPCNSGTFLGTQWPSGNTITLNQGQSYYMILFHHDHSWSGGDWFGATFQGPGDSGPPKDGDATKLTGSVVGFYFDPTGASISFAQQPQNVIAVQGSTATLSASATGTSAYGSTVFYQWQSAPKGSTTFTDITGATGATYTTPLLTTANDGTQYRVIATVAPITQTSSVATLTVTADTTPPVVTAGAMPDSVAGTLDIGVGFNKTVDASAGQIANYSVSGGTIASLTVYTNRFTADSQNPLAMVLRQSVLLKVTGLSGNSGVLTVNNITDTFGNKLSSTNVPFTASTMAWGVVGANQLGGTNAVVPVAPNGFDVYSDGIAEWGNYDETTFVYEQVTGDFDKKLRVEYQDGSSQWARAGLIVRDVTNFGVDAATQQGSQPGNTPVAPYDGKAGRYQKIHVNPVGATLGGPGNPGNAAWEGNRRLDTGSGCTTALTGVNSIPQYPNAWCRLKRVGQTFTIFRSDDGVNWINLGSTTWGVDDATKALMPATVYVGPEFSPENGNVALADQGTFLAAFRDYGNYTASVIFDPQLKIGTDPTGKITMSWTSGTLISSPTVQGTYSPVQSAVSPFTVTPSPGTTTFYRIKQ